MPARPWGRSKAIVREDVMALCRRRRGTQEDSGRTVGFQRPRKELRRKATLALKFLILEFYYECVQAH